jgi:hypothetical protein
MADIGIIKDTSVTSDSPGQTFINFFGEGGQQDSPTDAGREQASDRELWSDWFIVSRPPKSGTFATDDETEVVIQRLGPDDAIATNSKNREVESQVRSALSADLVPGDAVLFTGDGTNTVRIHLKPGGDVHIVTSGDVSLDPTGEVLIGGAAATDYVTLFNALKTEYDTHVHTCPPPLGNTGVPTVLMTNGPRATKGRGI